jgi:DNA-binding NtrC family response regulator
MNAPLLTLPRRLGSVLVVGDVPAGAALDTLGDTTAVTQAEAPVALARFDFDVIIVDGDGGPLARQLIAEAASVQPSAVRILLACSETDSSAADLAGAAILPKPTSIEALRGVCTMALQCAAARRTVRDLESENNRLRGIEPEPATLALDELADLERYEGVIYRSAAMRRVINLAKRIEGSETTVLVHGETGTGKELMAQAIHARSRRGGGRFVAVNLGAISDHLRESELFGHVRGAFTGATENRAGLFMEANGGCIFLDEVGDASPGLQVALLRVLEEGTITPVGSDRHRRVDVRIISGTNRNLDEMVAQGLLRRDLYYRLNVFPVELPPLRDRPEDIFPLAIHFLARAALAMGKKPPGISREARVVLESYHWEGNVRELRNVMERAAILCKGGLVIASDLPVVSEKNGGAGTNGGATIVIPPGGASLKQLEREIFVKTLALTGGNQTRAARMLGMRESTFRFRLQKLGIASRRGSGVQQPEIPPLPGVPVPPAEGTAPTH